MTLLRVYQVGDFISARMMREGQTEPSASKGLELARLNTEQRVSELPRDLDYLVAPRRARVAPAQAARFEPAPRPSLPFSAGPSPLTRWFILAAIMANYGLLLYARSRPSGQPGAASEWRKPASRGGTFGRMLPRARTGNPSMARPLQRGASLAKQSVGDSGTCPSRCPRCPTARCETSVIVTTDPSRSAH